MQYFIPRQLHYVTLVTLKDQPAPFALCSSRWYKGPPCAPTPCLPSPIYYILVLPAGRLCSIPVFLQHSAHQLVSDWSKFACLAPGGLSLVDAVSEKAWRQRMLVWLGWAGQAWAEPGKFLNELQDIRRFFRNNVTLGWLQDWTELTTGLKARINKDREAYVEYCGSNNQSCYLLWRGSCVVAPHRCNQAIFRGMGPLLDYTIVVTSKLLTFAFQQLHLWLI